MVTSPYTQYPRFFRVSCRPSAKKGGSYHGSPVSSSNQNQKQKQPSGYLEVTGGILVTWNGTRTSCWPNGPMSLGPPRGMCATRAKRGLMRIIGRSGAILMVAKSISHHCSETQRMDVFFFFLFFSSVNTNKGVKVVRYPTIGFSWCQGGGANGFRPQGLPHFPAGLSELKGNCCFCLFFFLCNRLHQTDPSL